MRHAKPHIRVYASSDRTASSDLIETTVEAVLLNAEGVIDRIVMLVIVHLKVVQRNPGL